MQKHGDGHDDEGAEIRKGREPRSAVGLRRVLTAAAPDWSRPPDQACDRGGILPPDGARSARGILRPAHAARAPSGADRVGDGLEAPRVPRTPTGSKRPWRRPERVAREAAGHLKRPEIREAIFVASPGLDECMDAWLEDPESERGQKRRAALVRYLARMAGRSTPFGLFAGCSVGTIGGRTRLDRRRRAPPTSATPASTWTTCSRSPRSWPATRPAAAAFAVPPQLEPLPDRRPAALRRGRGSTAPRRSRSYHLVAVDADRLPRRHPGARRRRRALGRPGGGSRRRPPRSPSSRGRRATSTS